MTNMCVRLVPGPWHIIQSENSIFVSVGGISFIVFITVECVRHSTGNLFGGT